MTRTEMESMLAWPGTFNYICEVCGYPTYTHTLCGPLLYTVTDEDRAAQNERAHK